jgi:outer membrane protein
VRSFGRQVLGGFVSVIALALGNAATPAHGADLRDLYVLALTNDPTYQAAVFTLQATRQLSPEALSALLPSLSASGSGSRTFGRTQYTDVPEVNRSFDTDQWVLQLTQPLFRAETLLAYGEARASVEQAVAQFAVSEQDLILRVTRAYFDEVIADRHVVAAQAQVAALSEQLHAARHSFEAGVASITDVDDTQSRAALADSEYVAAMNDLESARAALEAIVGTTPASLNTLKSNAVLPQPNPSDLASWVNRATADNPSVTAANAAVTVANYELDRSQVQRLPTVDMIATYGGNYSSGNITEPTNFGSNVKDRQLNVQVTVPLLEGGAFRAHVAEARAKRSKAQADFTGAQRQAALSARQSYGAVSSGISQVRALETAVAAGLSAVKGNRIGYGLGIRINSDVLNSEQQLYSTRQDLEKARYDTLFAGLKLKAATGELSPDDLRAVNSLLESRPPSEGSGDATLPSPPQ